MSVTGLMSYSRQQRGVVRGIREAGEASGNERADARSRGRLQLDLLLRERSCARSPLSRAAAPPSCPGTGTRTAPLRPAAPLTLQGGSPLQTNTCTLVHPLSPELSFFISFFVGLSDFGGFLNALLVLSFQHYWHVIATCVLPLGTLAQACTCWLQKCLSKGKMI